MKVHWFTYKFFVALTQANQEKKMSVAEVKKNADQRMQKSIETLKADLGKVRTGRAHIGILDHVMVDYYGTGTALTPCERRRFQLRPPSTTISATMATLISSVMP